MTKDRDPLKARAEKEVVLNQSLDSMEWLAKAYNVISRLMSNGILTVKDLARTSESELRRISEEVVKSQAEIVAHDKEIDGDDYVEDVSLEDFSEQTKEGVSEIKNWLESQGLRLSMSDEDLEAYLNS